MNRIALIWLVLQFAGLSVLAQQEGSSNQDDRLEVGDFAPDVEAESWITSDGDVARDKIPSLTELRGMVVVLYFWVSFHEGGEVFLPELNQLDANPALRTGVQIIGLTSGDRAAMEPQLQRNKVRFPVGISSKSAEDYRIESFPSFVIIDANGKIAQIGDSGQASSFAQTLNEVLTNVPPSRTHPEEAEKAVAKIEEARRRLRERDYKGAFEAARNASERATLGDPLKHEAYSLIDLIERIGYDQLTQVDSLLEQKKFSEAAVVLRTVAKDFRNLAPGKDAAKRTKAMEEENDAFKVATGDLAGEKAAGTLLTEGIADIRARRFGEGHAKLKKIVTDYSKTEAAEYAQPIIERLRANQDAWAYVSDHEGAIDSRQWLARAANLKSAGRIKEAKDLLLQVVTTYPNTVWAEQAKKELVDLPN